MQKQFWNVWFPWIFILFILCTVELGRCERLFCDTVPMVLLIIFYFSKGVYLHLESYPVLDMFVGCLCRYSDSLCTFFILDAKYLLWNEMITEKLSLEL